MDEGADVVRAQGKAMADRRRTVRCIKIILQSSGCGNRGKGAMKCFTDTSCKVGYEKKEPRRETWSNGFPSRTG